jgi:hypothetical protein
MKAAVALCWSVLPLKLTAPNTGQLNVLQPLLMIWPAD